MPQACKKTGVTDQAYYPCRAEYGGIRVNQAKRLKQWERENARLKQLVAEQARDIAILKRGGPRETCDDAPYWPEDCPGDAERVEVESLKKGREQKLSSTMPFVVVTPAPWCVPSSAMLG